MNVEIKERLVAAIVSYPSPEEIAVAIIESLRNIDANALNAPTYSSCLSNNDIWTGFIDEILK